MKPGYKLTEVGVIPEDWEVKMFERVFALKHGFAFSSEHFSKSGPIVLTPGNFRLEGGLYFEERNTKRYAGQYLEEMKFYRGDLLIVMTDLTPDCNLLGKPAFVETDDPILHNQRIGKVILKNNAVHMPFLYYLLLSRPYLNHIKEQAFGSTVRHTSNKCIYSVQLAWPLLDEQHAIAAALSDVDALLDGLERLIAKKRGLKQAAMQQLLTGQTRLPGFSGEWEVKRLGDFVSIRNQKVFPSRVNPDTPCLELEHVGQGDGRLCGLSTAQYSTSSKYRFFAGDVLFGRLRSYLRKYWLADRDGICTTEIWPLLVDDIQAVSGFLHALVQLDRFIEAASISYGTHMPRADWAVIRNFEVRLPQLNEQTAIADVLSDMDAEIAALEARRDKTRALKQGMMQELLTGRIRLV